MRIGATTEVRHDLIRQFEKLNSGRGFAQCFVVLGKAEAQEFVEFGTLVKGCGRYADYLRLLKQREGRSLGV